MRRANITECPYTALLTTILLQLLSRVFQATESFVYQQKSTIKLYIFKTCQTLSIVIRVGVLYISRVFWRIFTHLLYGSRPLSTQRLIHNEILRSLGLKATLHTTYTRVKQGH